MGIYTTMSKIPHQKNLLGVWVSVFKEKWKIKKMLKVTTKVVSILQIKT